MPEVEVIRFIRLRRWINSDTSEDDFYQVAEEQYKVIADLLNQGMKEEAKILLFQFGEKIDPPPTIEIDDF